ncbi:MAG: pilus assembly protein [Chloroflexota bacterium]|nr:pilus assembly protein [Chloroflexota bacterium]
MRKLQNFPSQIHRKDQRREQGQALLEFALIVPVLFIMLLGVAVIAQGFNLQMVLYGAAYDGARIWAKNPAGGDNLHCTPPACNPSNGDAINFEKYVIPAVRQYITNNGFDGTKVYFYARDDRGYRNTLNLVSNNPQLVNVSLLYAYELPVGNFASAFQEVLISASCTLKRGG